MKRDSVLMTDIEGRGNTEAIMDYVLAWTLKMCDRKNHEKVVNEALLIECRKILSKLVGIDIGEGECDVKTYMEWRKIDLVVEVNHNGDYHALLIENKVKTGLPEHELKDNKRIFTDHYDKDTGCIQHYWLICAYSPVPAEMIRLCGRDGFQYTTLEELSDYNAFDVENAIFDEFWRRCW